ncbi:caspase-1-like [Aedes albopictus]|uniref:Caspase n=1 Tax=Aedes albopictus TaxID=7160 RepID=A0ABM2A058_AEDAL|nr:caspase-1-like [Aedes albopictus]KXJ69202.1 hypothetical protein RP20_CCG028387 [Aedes albopictus]
MGVFASRRRRARFNTDSVDATRTFSQMSGTISKKRESVYFDTPSGRNDKAYSMNGTKRGKVLIFNQVSFEDPSYEERDGTHQDVKRLFNVLPRLGFSKEDITVYEDYSYSEINRIAVKLEYDEDLKQADCLMVFILTHGEEGDRLMAQDDSYNLHKFLENFTPTSLNSMAGKPKLFFIQACRGRKLDRGVLLRTTLIQADCGRDMVDSHSEVYIHPEFADLLVVMSSHHGHQSFRNESGSWFIQEFCNVIESCESLKTTSIYDILTETNNGVSQRISNSDGDRNKKKQIPSFYSTLTKKLCFGPVN